MTYEEAIELINKYETNGYDFEFIDNTGRIVRCRDCSWYDPEYKCCGYTGHDVTLCDYCSKAKTKEGDKD